MKKSGFTLVELMVSVTILLIILGTIGLITTSFMDTYTAGVRNEEGGSKVQTYFSYIISDLTPLDEEDEENFVEIKKYGTPTNKIEIKRSWYDGKKNENVVYTFSSGEVLRKEYEDGSEVGEGSRVLARTKNFDLRGIGLRVSKSSLEGLEKVTDREEYTSVLESDLQNGVKLGWNKENEGAERFIYYIEPAIDINNGSKTQEISRGYGLRFAPEIEKSDDNEDTPFMDVIGMRNGELKFEKKAYTKKSYNGRLPVVEISQNKKNTCREMKALDESIECEVSGKIPEEINIPNIDFGSYSDKKIGENKKVTLSPGSYKKLEIEKEAEVTFKEGVYKIGELDVKEEVEIIVDGKVKIYTSEVTLDKEVEVNSGADSSQLIFINKGNNFTLKEEVTFKGFIYSEGGKVLLEKEVSIEGSVIADKEVELKEESYIEYDRCGAIRFNKGHLENINDIDW